MNSKNNPIFLPSNTMLKREDVSTGLLSSSFCRSDTKNEEIKDRVIKFHSGHSVYLKT